MTVTPYHYVPVLRWRMGEYQGLEKLDEGQKVWVVPLIEILPPDFDFETQKPVRDLDAQLLAFGKQLKARWGGRRAFIDTVQIGSSVRMQDGRHPLTYIFDQGLEHGTNPIPVITLSCDEAHKEATTLILSGDVEGLALRCTLDEIVDPDFDMYVDELLLNARCALSELDILLDIGSPNYELQESLILIIRTALSESKVLRGAGSVTILGASFPESLADINGPLQVIPRREWLLYKELLRQLDSKTRQPGYGDYGIAATSFARGNMRYKRGSPNIRLAIEDAWVVAKGKREKKGDARKSYRDLCDLLKKSGHCSTPGFSAGSTYLEGCRIGTEKKYGSATVWKWVGTNQHITKVVHDLAKLRDA